MKPTHKILFGLVAASAWLIAGSVTIPHSFSANTTAKASEVNANFSAVKTAVDGNADDIRNAKTNIQTNTNNIELNQENIRNNDSAIRSNTASITTNTTHITANTSNIQNNADDIAEIVDERIGRVAAGGGLAGGGDSGDVTIRRASGSVAISPAAFHPMSHPDACFMNTYTGFAYFIDGTTTRNDCKAIAPVMLPDGATLTKLSCLLKDNDHADHPEIKLVRTYQSGATTYLFSVSTLNNNVNYIRVNDTTVNPDDPNNATVDNANYTYVLSYTPPTNTSGAGDDQALRGCSIAYTYQ